MKTYFVDTNYFLRFFLSDDKKQFEKAYELFSSAIEGKVKVFTSLVVFFEVYWVLSSFYKQNKDKYIESLQNILRMDYLEIDDKDVLLLAVRLFSESALALEDCFNIYYFKKHLGDSFATFDEKLLKSLAGRN